MRLDIAHGIPEFGHYLHTLARNVPRAGRRFGGKKEGTKLPGSLCGNNKLVANRTKKNSAIEFCFLLLFLGDLYPLETQKCTNTVGARRN